jgi:integrase
MKTRYVLTFGRTGIDEVDNTGLVQLKIYFSRTHRIFRSTGVRITADAWDDRRGVIKPKSAKHIRDMAAINTVIQRLDQHEFDLIRDGRAMTVADVDRIMQRGDDHRVFNAFMAAEMTKENALAPSTRRSHGNTIRFFNLFNARVTFAELTFDTIREFDNFLREQSLADNTIHAHHKRIKRHIQSAVVQNIIRADQNPYKGFKAVKTQNEMVALTMDEINAVAALNYTGFVQLDWVRDMFLFSCFTGLRFSDVSALETTHIETLPSGGHQIVLHRMRKVARPVFIPVDQLFNGRGETILKKYMPQSGVIFPPVSNPRCNELIKIIARDAGITRRVTFHTGRHTCATQIGAKTNDPMLIMGILGITKMETAMVYIKLSKEIMTAKVSQINW